MPYFGHIYEDIGLVVGYLCVLGCGTLVNPSGWF